MRAGRRVVLTAALVASGCEIGGGLSDASVTVEGEDRVEVLQEAEAEGTPAKLEFERATRSISRTHTGMTYVFDKTMVEQWLRLYVGAGGEETTFIVSEHDEASSFDTLGLEVAPDGSKVAYRLGDSKWKIVHMLGQELAVHDPVEIDDPLDWSKVDDFEAAMIRIYDESELRLDGLYSFNKIPDMLRWLRDERGEEAFVAQLMQMLATDDSFYKWDEHVELLSAEGKALLHQKLRGQVRTGMGNAKHYRSVFSQGVMDLKDPENLPVVRQGVARLVADQHTLMNKGEDLAAYLSALAELSPTDAKPIACELLKRADPPYALQEGRPARVAAEAACSTP